ncbi:hypothetical protein CO174_04280 [Candidatus Uhrbacteria bacterium CG_4_9_14_3_um_filter_50_9]|uniref:Uncharacterized protein n=1 Tax=Candidatus Uhrbacteria bacterium CG_4_9_14_3_um_filter_50_9 TaxID=1975035 RepID=A0A2M7XBE5_9BACT|nr:MAG: hypothetical protein CO174_04280 [Candidatus Uhrbacteria bacterium CG_4_9_14_3_um_filter_50_9]
MGVVGSRNPGKELALLNSLLPFFELELDEVFGEIVTLSTESDKDIAFHALLHWAVPDGAGPQMDDTPRLP